MSVKPEQADWLTSGIMEAIRQRVRLAAAEVEEEAQAELGRRIGRIVDEACLEAVSYYEVERFGERLVITVRRPEKGDE